VSDTDGRGPKADFEKDVEVDKPGIVGARWWHRSLVDEAGKVQRRSVLIGLAVAGGAVAGIAALGVGVAKLVAPEKTDVASRNALIMQKQYGWDFGARGVPLVFDGKALGPFVRTELSALSRVMAPAAQGPNTKYHVGTLVESLLATPSAALPDPEDGFPAPDSAPFKKVADVLMPIVTPAMQRAYGVGEAVARLSGWRQGLAVLVDLPGPEAVAFAAGACSSFEPVLLLDNWPHPYGVVPSHLTLAALAYYQPRFASQKERVFSAPLFVLDRSRTNPYTEAPTKFDNRYYARMPKLEALAKDGVRALLYVVSSPRALPEPPDLNSVLAAPGSAAGAGAPQVEVRAVALTDFASDPGGSQPEKLHYGGTPKGDATFWEAYAFGSKSAATEAPDNVSSTTSAYRFAPSRAALTRPSVGQVAVIATASGLILAAALDRRGSMNRFAGGWSG
jgi:hypothetical protein